METGARQSTKSDSLRTWSALVLIALLGGAYVLVATSRYGIGYGGDSGGYFGPARAILEGKPFLGSRLSVMWPPLYAVLLAFSAWLLGMDPVPAARFLNAALFSAVVLIPAVWILRRLRSSRLAVTVSLCLLFSYPLQVMAKMGLSDLLFVLLLILFLIFFERYFEKGRGRDVALAGLFAALASLARYAGVTLILSGGLFLLLDRRKSFVGRVRSIACFGAIAAIPLLLWLARNRSVSGTLFGERYPSPKSFLWNLASTLVFATHWFIPLDIPARVRAAVGAIAAAAVMVLVWRCIRRRALGEWSSTLLRLVLFAVLYLAYLVVSTTCVAVEQISLRYLLPAYVPAVIVSLSALWWMARSGGGRRRIVIAVFALLWFAMSITSDAGLMRLSLSKGTGAYSAKRWSESALIARLRSQPPDGPVYSNYPDPIYLLTRISAKRAPRRHAGNAPQVPLDQLRVLEARLAAAGPAYLAWFKGQDNRTLVPLDSLAAELRLETVEDLADGTLFRMRASGSEPRVNRK